jgi:bifunctional ADP-heptose synthase (sugar kinase/adenylyltransferase)
LNNPPKSVTQWKSGIESLREKLGHRFTFVTLSENGVLIEENGEVEILPAHLRNIADVSGAGDTVISTFTLCLAAGASPIQSTHISNCAAGIVVGKVGISVVKPEELIDRVKREIENK